MVNLSVRVVVGLGLGLDISMMMVERDGARVRQSQLGIMGRILMSRSHKVARSIRIVKGRKLISCRSLAMHLS
ncbi:hypothetical protein [Phormidium nigroviride]